MVKGNKVDKKLTTSFLVLSILGIALSVIGTIFSIVGSMIYPDPVETAYAIASVLFTILASFLAYFLYKTPTKKKTIGLIVLGIFIFNSASSLGGILLAIAGIMALVKISKKKP